jgi:hypothetical protein
MQCIGCGCTEERACVGGCHWVSVNPPVCSSCDEASRKVDSGFFNQERCRASDIGAVHAPIWIGENTGYCARCGDGFVA